MVDKEGELFQQYILQGIAGVCIRSWQALEGIHSIDEKSRLFCELMGSRWQRTAWKNFYLISSYEISIRKERLCCVLWFYLQHICWSILGLRSKKKGLPLRSNVWIQQHSENCCLWNRYCSWWNKIKHILAFKGIFQVSLIWLWFPYNR